MNYEEKYKEMKKRVLAIGQGYVKEVDYSSPRSIAEYIDPDLKESEDERIVKELISFLKEEEAKADITSKRSKTLCKYIVWLEKQSTSQVRTGPEWVTMIDDACDKRYSEEYAHGEYCHEQSFKWGFQEGVDWLEKQGDKVDVLDDFPTEFERQISHLIASSINKEWEYKKDFVKHTANALLQYAKNELEKQGEQKSWSEEDEEKRKLLISILEVNHPNGCFKVNPINTSNMEVMSTKELVNWLKSIKPNRWKPSEEQIEAIKYFIDFHRPQANASTEGWNEFKHLESLYNELRRLKEN